MVHGPITNMANKIRGVSRRGQKRQLPWAVMIEGQYCIRKKRILIVKPDPYKYYYFKLLVVVVVIVVYFLYF